MRRSMFKSKLHRVRVTEANLDYEGSITIDQTLMEAGNILPYEHVHVWNVSNGSRLETYAIPGPADSGVICLNGSAARSRGMIWDRSGRSVGRYWGMWHSTAIRFPRSTVILPLPNC